MGLNKKRFLRVSTVSTVAAVTLAMGATAGAVDNDATSSAPQTTQNQQAEPEGGAQPAQDIAQPATGGALKPLSVDAIKPAPKPQLGQEFIDPAYQTRIHRATDISEGEGGHMRHEYSRRQAFNADNSRYLIQDGRGAWYLYDAANFQKLEKLAELAGDCEPIWHPTDPNKIYMTSRNGGTVWWSYDISTKKKDVLFDFAGKTPWPEATSYWTKGEGTMSADGRYLALMATTYDESTQKNKIYGILMLDIQDKKVVGTLDAKDFPVPGAFPDHISTSASGKYAVPSWLYGQGGTRAYNHDFSQSIELASGSEHSDLAFGPNKEDYFVYADYGSGKLTAVDIDTQNRIDLNTLYPASGEAYALHVSGQAFAKPGWAVVSTYADSANYNKTYPAPELRPEYRKVWLVELKPNGRKLNVAHIRSGESKASGDAAYFLEPQASASRDLSRIIYTSNFGENATESYIVDVPGGFDK